MSRRARPRAVGRVVLNTMQIAANGARKLHAEDVAEQINIVRQAVAEFCRGQHCARHWSSLADTSNMAETLASMGLASGADVADRLATVQQVLGDVHGRHSSRGSWTLYADEIEALLWLAPIHELQLQACSYSEFTDAYQRTARRMAQALAGNAAPDSVVVVGQFGGSGVAA